MESNRMIASDCVPRLEQCESFYVFTACKNNVKPRNLKQCVLATEY